MKKIIKEFALIFAFLCMVLVCMPNETFAATVTSGEEFRAAIEEGTDTEIILGGNISLDGIITSNNIGSRSPAPAVVIARTITINGQGNTISTTSVRTMIETYATTEPITITFNNVKLENSYSKGRCIDTRTGDTTLNLNSTTSPSRIT